MDPDNKDVQQPIEQSDELEPRLIGDITVVTMASPAAYGDYAHEVVWGEV